MPDRPVGLPCATRSVVHAPSAMVAAAHPLAVQAGLDVMREGGSAVDAAIAVNAVLAVVEPTACGLGGDLFAMVWDGRTLHGINGSGRAPATLTPERITPTADGTIPLQAPSSWTVPGCVDGWHELHARFGRVPWKRLLGPATGYAQDGAPVPAVISAHWAAAARQMASIPGFAQVFMPGGRPPAEGEPFRNPALAATLTELARNGRDEFYEGAIARAIVAFSHQVGGFLDEPDLARHTSSWVTPLHGSYRTRDVWQLPPNGQGLAVIEMLHILERFELGSLGRDDPRFWHLMIEAKKLAYEDLARHFADPAAMATAPEAFIDRGHARARAGTIDPDHAARRIAPGRPPLTLDETTFLATGDGGGMMVALIQSNYTGFGSGHAIPSLGFGMQNRGALFSLDPAHPNVLAPGKRPFHTIIPAFLGRGGRPDTAFGVMGGDMQPQGQVQIVANLVDFGMNLQEAGDAARFHHTGTSEPTGRVMLDGGRVYLESGVPDAVRTGLRRRGHLLADGGYFGGYQAIERDARTGYYRGASESRKDGMAAGF